MAPFFLAYGLLRGAYIGTEALATVTIHVTKLGVYGSYSFLTPDNLLVGFSIGVVAFLGSYLGRRILARVPDRIFPIIIESVLVISGALFLIRG
jgi:hypothetical protein